LKLSQRVLIIGDTHIGSDVALSPEELILKSNNRILANEIQLAILQEYYDMIDDVGTVDLLILNGDLVEGTNYYGEGAGCTTTSMSAQDKVAIDLLSQIKFRKVVGCVGTKYHGKCNPNHDQTVIEGLGGVCMDEISMNIEQTRIYANHRTPVRMTQWESRPQSIAKDMLLNELNAMDFGHYDIICKSHVHYYIALDQGTSVGFVCPCWKGRDDFAKGACNPFAFNPSIGYVMFDIETDGSFAWTKSVKHLKGNSAIKTYDIEEIPNRF
jgi:predicted phosphodiesterase